MTHIMVDLETLSTDPNAHIVSIGAVKFDRERGVYDTYYQPIISPEINVHMQSHITDDGLHVSNDTIQWWMKQEAKARAVLTDPNAVPLRTALKGFITWASDGVYIKNIRLWGNGASFDNVILASAYRVCSIEQPWMFWNDRCYRTIKNEYPNVIFTHTGIEHNALHDAMAQAEHLLKTPTRL
jgi:hypothetical protein